MKKNTIVFLILIMGISCNKAKQDIAIDSTIKEDNQLQIDGGGSSLTTPQLDSIVNIYSKVGEVHNEGLDYVFTQLENMVDSAGTNPLYEIESIRIMNESTSFIIDSLSSTNISFAPLYYNDSIIVNENASQMSFANHTQRITGSRPSLQLTNALAALEIIIKDSTLNKDSASYDILMQRVYGTALVDSDKIIFAAAVKVSQSSIKYWNTNHEKWDTLASHIKNGTNRGGITSKSWTEQVLQNMAFADGVGAVTGAIRGMWLGLTAGTIVIPGIGTVAGAGLGAIVGCISGSLIGSVGAGIEGLARHFIGW